MNRLLSADFAKLRKYKFFWFSTAGMFLFGIFMVSMSYIALIEYGEKPDLSNTLFIYALTVVFIIPAFVSLFIGTEYSDGTIRNKMIIGHTRTAIYLSNLIVCSTAGLAFCIAYLAGALAVGIPLCGLDDGALRGIVILVLCGFLMSFAFTSLCTLTGILCQNKALAAVVNILAACFLIVMSIYVFSKLEEPETYMTANIITTEEGEIREMQEVDNPGYLKGTERDIYQFFNDFLPTGQAVNITQGGGLAEKPEFLAASSVFITAAAAGIGIFVFRRRDVK